MTGRTKAPAVCGWRPALRSWLQPLHALHGAGVYVGSLLHRQRNTGHCLVEVDGHLEGPPHLRAEQRPIGDYTAELRRLLPDARIEVGEAPVHVGQLMDNTRIREELGFEPRYTIETGLADYIERIRSAPDVTGR